MTKIVIPKPCSEDWNKMTPTEKGAFCKKCNLEVIDFTKKTNEEIREILTLRVGQKTCGHIGKQQLEMANSNFLNWENQSPKIFLSKFLYACVIGFGLSLFTGCENQVTGEIEPHYDTVDGGMEIITNDTIQSCDKDSIEISDTNGQMSLGEMSMQPETE